MNSVAIEILFIALLVTAKGIFAMSKMAMVSARKVRFQQRADEGDKGARPVLNLFYPELSGLVEPLSCERAARRTAVERLPFFAGEGVERCVEMASRRQVSRRLF